jgi:hypothetical protein
VATRKRKIAQKIRRIKNCVIGDPFRLAGRIWARA